MPCHPARARELLDKGKAVIHRLIPFVIRLKDRVGGDTQPIRLLDDPGSKESGFALVRETPAAGDAPVLNAVGDDVSGSTRTVLFKMELTHRGDAVHKSMETRRSARHGRRSRKLRYRAPKFDNRRRPEGWLAPSLRTRLDTTVSWVARLRQWAPITSISMELVRFDTQAMETPEIEGVEYQRGTLFGYELRGYVLARGNHACAYCGARDVPLNLDHVIPRAKGGSDRVSNLAPACIPCNERKSAKPLAVFLKNKPDVLRRVMAQLKAPLKDAAAVNTTRWALRNALLATGLPVEIASGGRTKWNRTRLGIPKTHANDAICVGRVGAVVGHTMRTLFAKCTGRGDYQRQNSDAYGFPCGEPKPKTKKVHGFRTGDIVRAVVPDGKRNGTHVGRVAVRTKGYFAIATSGGRVDGVAHRHCRIIQRADGYEYQWTARVRPTTGAKVDAIAI